MTGGQQVLVLVGEQLLPASLHVADKGVRPQLQHVERVELAGQRVWQRSGSFAALPYQPATWQLTVLVAGW